MPHSPVVRSDDHAWTGAIVPAWSGSELEEVWIRVRVLVRVRVRVTVGVRVRAPQRAIPPVVDSRGAREGPVAFGLVRVRVRVRVSYPYP